MCLNYCGNRLSNVSFVIIASSIPHCVYFIVVFWFYLVVFSEWEVEHEMLLLLKQLIMLSSPFRVKLLFLLLEVEKGISVIEKCCFRLCLLMCDLIWIGWLDFMLPWFLEMSKTRLWVFIREWLIVSSLGWIKYR